MPDVLIVVVTYNSAHVVGQLLGSVPDALGGRSAQVVVVDNGSTDDTAAVAEQAGADLVVRSKNSGYAAGLNRGIQVADQANAILILNPDVVLEPGSIPAMLAALDRPAAGIVAPQVRNADGTLNHSLRREPSLTRTIGLTGTRLPLFAEYLNRDEDYENARVVDWAVGAVLLMSRACYDAVGGWDESYFLYSEETDFCLRARDLGFATWYEPTARAMHIGGASGQSPTTHAMHIVNRVRLYRRRHGAVASLAYLGLNLAREATWIRRGGERHRVAIAALVRPARRPAELGCSDRLLPR